MSDSFDSFPRRKVRRKGRKPKPPKSPFLLIAAGAAAVVLLLLAVLFSSTVVQVVAEPWNITILAAQGRFEAAHKADREQNPYLAIWRPVNPLKEKFNILVPMPYTYSARTTPDNRSYEQIYRSLTEPLNPKSPIVQVGVILVTARLDEPMSKAIMKFTDADIRNLMKADQIFSNQAVTWKGRPCREVEIMTQGRRIILKFLPIAHDKYILLCFDYEGEPPRDQINRFFDSFVSTAEPDKYESPGWPAKWNDDVKEVDGMSPGTRLKIREMDRSRWLKAEDDRLDVLAHINVFKDANYGEWYTYGKGVVSPHAKTTMLVLPVEPIDSYELSLNVRRLSATPESFNIGLIVGGHPAMVVIDGFGSRTTCLHPVDGEHGIKSDYVHKGRLLHGWTNAIRVRVTPKSLQLNVNGKDIFNFEGDPSRLGLDYFWTPPENSIFIGSWDTQYYITKCELRKL